MATKQQEMTKKGQFFDYSTLILVLVLVAFGLVMVYSTSSYVAAQKGNAAFYFKNQLKNSIFGILVMTIVTFIPYTFYKKISGWFYIFATLFIFSVLTSGGKSLNGARRWVYFGSISIQPAEIVKLAAIIFFSAFANKYGKNMAKFKYNIVYIIFALIPAMLIYKVTENLSSALIIIGIAAVLLVVANPRPKWLIAIMLFCVLAVIVAIIVFFNMDLDNSELGFRLNRILVWKNPEKYSSETGYQTLQALYAIGSGGFFGKGLGQSMQKLGFLPEAQNDMIFSIICEELGLFGGICIIVLFVLLIYRFMVIANNAPDLFSSMLVTGVLAHIAIQVIFNIAVVTNLFPNTGISLPFISYGGSSVVILLVEMGIVLNISRNIRVPVAGGGRRGHVQGNNYKNEYRFESE